MTMHMDAKGVTDAAEEMIDSIDNDGIVITEHVNIRYVTSLYLTKCRRAKVT